MYLKIKYSSFYEQKMTSSFFSSAYKFNATDDKTWQFMEESPHKREIFKKMTPAFFTLYIVISYGTGLVLTVKYILAETYDFFLYFVIISLFTQVRDSATEAVSSGCPQKIEKWLQEHQECCRFILTLFLYLFPYKWEKWYKINRFKAIFDGCLTVCKVLRKTHTYYSKFIEDYFQHIYEYFNNIRQIFTWFEN